MTRVCVVHGRSEDLLRLHSDGIKCTGPDFRSIPSRTPTSCARQEPQQNTVIRTPAESQASEVCCDVSQEGSARHAVNVCRGLPQEGVAGRNTMSMVESQTLQVSHRSSRLAFPKNPKSQMFAGQGVDVCSGALLPDHSILLSVQHELQEKDLADSSEQQKPLALDTGVDRLEQGHVNGIQRFTAELQVQQLKTETQSNGLLLKLSYTETSAGIEHKDMARLCINGDAQIDFSTTESSPVQDPTSDSLNQNSDIPQGKNSESVVVEDPNRCPICLSTMTGEAFLDPCFHSFCFHCILQWSEMVRTHPSLEGDTSLECPLCKIRGTCIVHNVVLGTFQRYYLYDIQTCNQAPFLLSDKHYQRLMIYRRNLHSKVTEALSRKRKRQLVTVKSDSLEQWVRRELQALMHVEDVDIVTCHVLGVLEQFDKRKKSQNGVCSLWKDVMPDAIRPFIYENAEKFCEELQTYIHSGLRMSAYDELVKEVIME